jgi:hypothetical protein
MAISGATWATHCFVGIAMIAPPFTSSWHVSREKAVVVTVELAVEVNVVVPELLTVVVADEDWVLVPVDESVEVGLAVTVDETVLVPVDVCVVPAVVVCVDVPVFEWDVVAEVEAEVVAEEEAEVLAVVVRVDVAEPEAVVVALDVPVVVTVVNTQLRISPASNRSTAPFNRATVSEHFDATVKAPFALHLIAPGVCPTIFPTTPTAVLNAAANSVHEFVLLIATNRDTVKQFTTFVVMSERHAFANASIVFS